METNNYSMKTNSPPLLRGIEQPKSKRIGKQYVSFRGVLSYTKLHQIGKKNKQLF